MAHRIKPEDLEDYIKFIAVNRGCPVESVDRNKAHWTSGASGLPFHSLFIPNFKVTYLTLTGK